MSQKSTSYKSTEVVDRKVAVNNTNNAVNNKNSAVNNIFVPLAPSQVAEILPVPLLGKEVETNNVLPRKALIIDGVATDTVGKKSGIKLHLAAFTIELECNFCAKTLSTILSILDERC